MKKMLFFGLLMTIAAQSFAADGAYYSADQIVDAYSDAKDFAAAGVRAAGPLVRTALDAAPDMVSPEVQREVVEAAATALKLGDELVSTSMDIVNTLQQAEKALEKDPVLKAALQAAQQQLANLADRAQDQAREAQEAVVAVAPGAAELQKRVSAVVQTTRANAKKLQDSVSVLTGVAKDILGAAKKPAAGKKKK